MSVRNNTIWNISGTGLPMLIGLAAIPVLIDKLGLEAFGLLTIIWTTIGYLSLFDFGLGRALTQQISSTRHLGTDRLANLVLSGLGGTLVLGIFGGLILYLASPNLVFNWLKISPQLQDEAFAAMLLAALSIPMVTLSSGLRGVLEGFEDFKTSNLLRLTLGSLNFLLPLLVVLFVSTSLTAVVWSLIVSRALVLVLHFLAVNKYYRFGKSKPKFIKNELAKLFSFGFWMTLSNLIGPIMVVADRFFISAVLGASVVAYYTVPQDFVVRLLIIPAALATALFPRLAHVHASLGQQQSKALFAKGLKTTALVMAPFCLMLALASYEGLRLWLGHDFAVESWKVLAILAVGIFFNSLAHVPFAALQALGHVRTTSLIHIAEVVVYIPLLLLLLHSHGIIGAAVAWAVRALIDFAALQLFAVITYRKDASIR